jgi:hypothetical protein
MRAFLSLVGYYKHFIQDFGAIASPLTKLLCKERFQWTPDAEAAFRALQHALTLVPILQLPMFNREFIVECDTSGSGIRAMLHKGEGVVTYFNKQMAPCHTGLVAYEHDFMDLVHDVQHWCPYLWVRKFLVRTDHVSLKYLLNQRLSTIPQHQWVSKLLGLDFRMEYKHGASNGITDALSWWDSDEPIMVHALSAPSFQLLDDLRAQALTDLE